MDEEESDLCEICHGDLISKERECGLCAHCATDVFGVPYPDCSQEAVDNLRTAVDALKVHLSFKHTKIEA